MIKKVLNAIKEGKFKERLKGWHFRRKNKKNFHDDEKYLSEEFNFTFGYYPNIIKPKTYNEKLLWLKLNWRDDRCYDLVDKFKVRSYLQQEGLENILIPLYGVYDSWNDINFDVLPNQFVIKTTHGGGSTGVFIVTNKFDEKQLKKAKTKMVKSLNSPNDHLYKEWVYDIQERKIIIERLMIDPLNASLPDYKIFCFDGKAKFLFVGTERNVDVKFDFFDIDWNWLDVRQGHENNKNRPEMPKNFSKMVEIAEKLSGDFPQVRIDLYNIDGKIYFGEMTFFHFAADVPFDPPAYDEEFGKYIDIEKIKNSKYFIKP